MGSTNKTTNLQLPQWIGTDKPTFLGDFNDAFLKIDNGYGTISGDASTAIAQAGQAVQDSEQALEKVNSVEGIANTANTNANNALNTANNAQTGVNNLTPRVNTLETEISNVDDWVNVEITNHLTTNLTRFNGFCCYNESLKLLSLACSWLFSETTILYPTTPIITLGNYAPTPSEIRTIFAGFNGSVTPEGRYTTTDITYNTNKEIKVTNVTSYSANRFNIQLMLCTALW